MSALSVAQTPPTTNERQTAGPAVCAATCPVLQVKPLARVLMTWNARHGYPMECNAVNKEVMECR